jgi:hypothetical protein
VRLSCAVLPEVVANATEYKVQVKYRCNKDWSCFAVFKPLFGGEYLSNIANILQIASKNDQLPKYTRPSLGELALAAFPRWTTTQ